MTQVLQELIDKQDNFEIIRDQIAAIIKTEVVNQMALAITAGKDPLLWDLRVFTERSNPWENLSGDDHRPVINVWYSTSNFDKSSARGVVDQQKANGLFNIDCYARGQSASTVGGHSPGDEDAALQAHRALRLVRNILMSSVNTFLQLRGIVSLRWPQSIETLQPDQDTNSVEQIIAGRIALSVDFVEMSPQYVGEPLEVVSITVFRREDGEILLEAEYDYDPDAPVNITPPAVSGGNSEGVTLTTTRGAWSGFPTGYIYQWFRDGAPISGATSDSYTTQVTDGNTNIHVEVIAANSSGQSVPESSNTIFVQALFEAAFDTNLPGSPPGELTLPFTPNAGNLIDWGDGTINNLAAHDYGVGNIETVRISGTIDDWAFKGGGDAGKLTLQTGLGPHFMLSTTGAWHGCDNMQWTVAAGDVPTITTTNLTQTFHGAVAFNGDLSQWDFSNVTDMTNMFFGCSSNTGIGAQNWDVGNVTDLVQVFFANSVFNAPVGVWDTSSATSMNGLFRSCTIFNQNINAWNVSNVISASHLFASANAYNKPMNLWDVSSMQNMHSMLGGQSFNQDISMWTTSALTNPSFMFAYALAFNQDISGWDLSNATNMAWMFKGAAAFDQDLTGWDVGNVTNMTNMLDNSGLSQTNYDNYLDMCAGQPVQVAVTLGALGLSYTAPSAGRNTLTNTPPLWNIVGDIAA